jgi:hypothetical protein
MGKDSAFQVTTELPLHVGRHRPGVVVTVTVVRLICVGRVPGCGVGSPGASRLVNGHLQRPRPAIRLSSRVGWSSRVSATWALAFRARRNTDLPEAGPGTFDPQPAPEYEFDQRITG